MGDYVKDIINEEEKKKDKSIVDKLKSIVGAKDYKEELPHNDDEFKDRPWDDPVLKPKVENKPTNRTTVETEVDDPMSHSAENQADYFEKRNKKIAKKVGGWSR